MTAWDTDLGRWRLAWVEYLRGGANSPGIPDGSVETADDAFAREIALARSAVEGEVCDDERDADAVAPDAPHDPDAGCAGCKQFRPATARSWAFCGPKYDVDRMIGTVTPVVAPSWCPERARVEALVALVHAEPGGVA